MKQLHTGSTAAANDLEFLMIDSTDHITGKTGLTPTVTLRKAAGSFASPSGAVAEIANGWYKVAANATDNGTVGGLLLHATGTGADPTDVEYQVVSYDPFDSVRLGLTALPNAAAEAAGGLYTRGSGAGQINQPANGQIDANAVKLGGTSQTGRDIGASVLLSSGTGAGQLDFTSGVVKANLVQILASAITGTAANLVAAFTAFFNVASPVFTTASVNQTGDAYARLGAPAGASHAADVAAVKVDTAAVKTQTDKLAFTVANQVDANLLSWKGTAPAALSGTYVQSDIERISGATTAVTGLAAYFAYVGLVAMFTPGTITTTSVVLTGNNPSSVDDYYKGQLILVYSGTGNGQVRRITGYVGSTKVATIDHAWDTTPTASSMMLLPSDTNISALMAALQADTDDIQTRLPAALVGGRMDSSVGSNLDKTGYALTSGEHTGIASDAQAGMTAQGYTTTRAPYLDTLNGLVQAIWDKALTGITTAGSIGKLIKDNLDAAISTRTKPADTQAAVTLVTTTTTLTNAPPDSAGVTTLLARLGAFTGTGVNTVLGFLKALMSKAASTPSDVGGTFDASTDANEALRDTAPMGTAMRGTDSALLAVNYVTPVDHYQAKIWMVNDNAAGTPTDRYSIRWFKNEVALDAGITSPTIQVVKEDDSDLIAVTAMTQIGTSGRYKYDAVTTERMADGASYEIRMTATIDAATQTWKQPISRDS